MNNLSEQRRAFFNAIANEVDRFDGRFIVLTHLLEDRDELFDALSKIAPIDCVIAIPYSVSQQTLAALKKQYAILTPKLEQLFDAAYLKDILLKTLKKGPAIIVEIGGYFSAVIGDDDSLIQERLLGIVEDTESGLRKYIEKQPLNLPVFSIARSELKQPEDRLVGSSCLYSVESILRSLGHIIENQAVAVLGYGKIGRGLASALRQRGCIVSVYDNNPIRRIEAISDGFLSPEKAQLLSNNSIIFGATANYSIVADDFVHLSDHAILVSCSSKDIEFDLSALYAHFKPEKLNDDITRLSRDDKCVYLLREGLPINFKEGAVIGPLLALSQAEIFMAIHQLLVSSKCSPGIHRTDVDAQYVVANLWLSYFVNRDNGNIPLVPID